MKGRTFSKNMYEMITEAHFGALTFLDDRERHVFEEYLRSFSWIAYTDDIESIVEIGAGHSTLIFSQLAKTRKLKVQSIDLNPESMLGKLRDEELVCTVTSNVEFVRQASISAGEFFSYYESDLNSIGGVNYAEVLICVDNFIDLVMDARRAPKVKKALSIAALDQQTLKNSLLNYSRLPDVLIDSYRYPGDEFDFFKSRNNEPGVLAELVTQSVDAIFLDSGEFASLVEWEIVSQQLRVGGYVFLHDIYFPKSFKNWLVCASIVASDDWEVLYQDTSTPQGMMLARKIK